MIFFKIIDSDSNPTLETRYNLSVIEIYDEGTILDEMLKPEELTSVKAWINVCGVLKGTPVADYLNTPFRRVGLHFAKWFIGKPKIKVNALLDDLSYEHCKSAKYKHQKTHVQDLHCF